MTGKRTNASATSLETFYAKTVYGGREVRIPPPFVPVPEGETECRCAHSLESQHVMELDRRLGRVLEEVLHCTVEGCGCIRGRAKAA